MMPAVVSPATATSSTTTTTNNTTTNTTTTTTTTAAAAAIKHSRRVPLDKRKRTETSCDKCKSRKQKCRKEPGQVTCRYCQAHGIACQTTQPRKKRLYGSVEGLSARLALLEALVVALVPGADVSTVEALRQLAASLGVVPPAGRGDSSRESEGESEGAGESDEALALLPDQQGQVQYIGPASSLVFHFNLRTLVGRGTKREFTLFGRNAAQQHLSHGDSDPRALAAPSHHHHHHHQSPPALPAALPAARAPGFESLMAAFFERINPDVPILHEPSFRAAYDAWLADHANFDPAWLCSFLCVLLLARPVAHLTFPAAQETVWWHRVQTLLPVVVFTTSVTAVQALLLAAIHLHNSNHRDACWNLTGTAVRIAYAIGLHQDKAGAGQTPVTRELRKQLWWTLYAMEQSQITSYDRPGAMYHPGPHIACPNETILGTAGYYPLDYRTWIIRLMTLMGSVCRAPKTIIHRADEETYVGPLSPAAAALRDLQSWMDSLPPHLRFDAIDSSLHIFQRPLSILHAWYHYIIVVLGRSALLVRASSLAKEGREPTNAALVAMAKTCSDAGQELARILLRLDSLGKFDGITTCDVFFSLTAASVLVLDLVCLSKTASPNLPESRVLLTQLAELAQRHRRNPYMPGTMQKFASLIPELHSMAAALDSASTTATSAAVDTSVKVAEAVVGVSHPPRQPTHNLGPFHHLPSTNNSESFAVAENMQYRYPSDPVYPQFPGDPDARFETSTQSHFMEFTMNNIHDWDWGDLSNLLGTETMPNMFAHG